MTIDAYAPPRGLASKVGRRLTQWRAARPATLRFDAPVLSICFDDFPKSAAIVGADIVLRNGGRATFYAAASAASVEGPCGPGFGADDLARLAKGGHEIGCHTYAHHDCARADVDNVLGDLVRNREALWQMGFEGKLRSLAYPYGETSTALKQRLPQRFACARGILPGLNGGPTDLAQLRAYALFGADGLARARQGLHRAAQRKAWLIAFTHDVCDAPSPWGTSTGDLDSLLALARGLGVRIVPVARALELAR